MTVILTLATGKLRLDRNYRTDQVAKLVNDAREDGKLIELQNDSTPSRTLHVDPAAVIAITNDGYTY